MPIQQCQVNGKSGYKWGASGKCFTGPNAKEKALKQAIAIGGGKMPKDKNKEYDESEQLQDEIIKVPKKELDQIKKSLNIIAESTHTHSESSKDEEDEILRSLLIDAFDESKMLLTSKGEKTPEGFLKTRAIVTNTGIFNYLTQDGKIIKQLRAPEEVFKRESLDSLKNKPITDGHPYEKVTSDNIKKYQVGFTGSDVSYDGHAVSVDMTITDTEMIKKIEAGDKKALSCGYEAVLDFSQSGHAFGNNPYDVAQTDIKYNHVAVVEQGRAGDLAKIPMNIDSINTDIYTQIIPKKEDLMEGKKNDTTMVIDGVNYDVDKDVAKYVHSLNKKIETRDSEIVELNKNLTTVQATNDAQTQEIEKLKNEKEENVISDEDIQKRINDRLELFTIADSAKVEYEKTISNNDLKLAIIKSRHSKADFTDKDETFVDAYFQSVKDSILEDAENKNTNENKKIVFGDYVNTDSKKEEAQTRSSKQKMYDEYAEKVIKESQEYKGAVSV